MVSGTVNRTNRRTARVARACSSWVAVSPVGALVERGELTARPDVFAGVDLGLRVFHWRRLGAQR